jgi:hypothetical protein
MGIFKSNSTARQPEKLALAEAPLLPFNIAPVHAVIDTVVPHIFPRGSKVVRTLSELDGWLEDNAVDGSLATMPEERAPVTAAQIDEALAVLENLQIPDGENPKLHPLRQVRALVAAAPVTREEIDAVIRVVGTVLALTERAHDRQGYADGKISHQLEYAERHEMPTLERSTLKQIVQAFEAAMNDANSADQRRARERGNKPYQPGYTPY